MYSITLVRRRLRALAPAAVLLLALCLLAGGAQASYTPGIQRYVAGDILEITASNMTSQIVIAKVDTTSLPTPYYTAFDVVENAGRWEIPRYWDFATKVDEQNLVENLHAQRVGHIDPVLVIITDDTITGGFMQYTGLSLAEANAGVIYPVEPAPGEWGNSPLYVVGDVLGNVSDPNHGAVVSRVFEQDGRWWYNTYLDTARSGDRWMIEKFYNGDFRFPESVLIQNGDRRVAHADPHIVIVNDSTTSTGEIGWYRLSLAEVLAGKSYDHMGSWHFVTGDILGNETAQYIVTNATTPQSGPSHYTLREAVRAANGWEIPTYVNDGFGLEVAQEAQLDAIPFTFDDHTDPHFAIVTDPSVANGVTFDGLSLGEILEGTPGYPVETGPVVGGDKGYFLVSTAPAGAAIYLEDISGTRYLEGNTSAGPLNVTIMLTATPMKQIVANLSGYRDAVYNITQYPAKGETVPVSLTLEQVGPQPYRPLSVPGRIQAEDYNLGGEGVAYHDTTPGNTGGAYRHDDVDIETGNGITDVGWIRNGEYLTYTVNVTTAGTYTVTARTASPNSGRTIALSVDGVPAVTIAVPNTGSFDTYRDATPPLIQATATQTPVTQTTSVAPFPQLVALSAGSHTLKLAFAGDGQNLDWFELTAVVPPTPPTPTPTPTVGPQPYIPLSIPGTIQAEDYNLGGEGVAYHDTTPGNEGGAYRHDDVDIETGNGITNVGWIRNGEYLTYTANVTTAGAFTMSARVASPNAGRTIAVSVDGASAASIAVPNTGSFATFRTVEVPVTLAAGTHTLKLAFSGDGQNLDWIAFGVPTTPTVTSTPTPTPTAGGASFTAAPLTASHGSAVKFTLTPAAGKTVGSAWWSFDAPAHLNTWNSRATNPTFFYPAAGTFSPLVKIVYTDGTTETVQRTNYVRAT